MALVCVAGASSRAGKTALAVTLLRPLAGRAAAVKFTTTEDVFERCPRGTPCVVCDIEVPFRIVEDPALLRQAGTDTERLTEAGASRVLWVIAKQKAAARAWAAVRQRLAGSHAVMEGSTVVGLADPDLVLFVAHPFLAVERWKPTSSALLQRADAVIVNRPGTERRRPSPAVLAEIRRWRNRDDVRIANVTEPLADWAPDLADRLLTLVQHPRTLPGAVRGSLAAAASAPSRTDANLPRSQP